MNKNLDFDWRVLHEKFAEYGRNAKEWMRKCVMMLPEIEKHKIWKKKGFENIYEYARQIAGMSRERVNDALWILKKIEDKPSIMQVVNEKGLNAVRPIISIIDKGNEKFWAEKAKIMSHHTLRTFAKGIKNQNRLEFRDVTDSQSVKLQKEITMQLNPEIADQLEKLKGQGDWNELMEKFLALHKEKLEQEKPEVVEDASRSIPKAIEKHVIAKTNGMCAFPGCQKPYEILHHTDRLAMYHTHDPDHIIPLCKAHERLAHLGLIENENEPPQFWKIRLQPDYDDPKYEIDRVVEKLRTGR